MKDQATEKQNDLLNGWDHRGYKLQEEHKVPANNMIPVNIPKAFTKQQRALCD